MTTASEVSLILTAVSSGDRSQVDRLMELVYGELRGLARRYLRSASAQEPFQPTELVHEAFLKLVGHPQKDWRGRSHFYAVAATAMRQILVDEARKRLRVKRGGGQVHVSLEDQDVLSTARDEDVLAVDDVLARLATVHPRRARLVELRFFGNMSLDEVAEALQLSTRTVQRDWDVARAWLRRELARSPADR
jgi:RNA polymerase sigma-70 factor (ECF subfamily)